MVLDGQCNVRESYISSSSIHNLATMPEYVAIRFAYMYLYMYVYMYVHICICISVHISICVVQGPVNSGDGILVFGLYLDGARWDIEQKCLHDSKPGHRFSRLPELVLQPTQVRVSKEYQV